MIKRVLVGYDGSESSQRAFRLALDMVRPTGGQVCALRVLQLTEGGADAMVGVITDNDGELVAELQRELASLAPQDVARFEVRVVYGSPGDALLAEVTRGHHDHIVIGHTARGSLLSWLLGSVSNDVLARAPVPVTVVRGGGDGS